MKNKNSKSTIKEKMTNQYPELEKLILDFSARFANASVDKIDNQIENALQKIAEYAGFDRCGFWKQLGSNLYS